ncbi:hypothetical protein QYE76_038862 [Lolium multiflorum]|uniref:Uncharacterized protein n=1 Tax=Lolium multiflorum TaxID=4521 RepID=A0AAD8TA12_LOLMU|nr:hypothetical protein QYE76_038862 [Lolium multiflorum]
MASPSAAVATKAQLAHVAFSMDASHLVACTGSGLRVFSCDKLLELVYYRRNGTGDEVTCAELLTESNLAAVIRSPNATDGAADVYGVRFMEWRREEGDAGCQWRRGQKQRQTTVATKTLGTPGLGAVGGLRLLGDHMLVAGEKKAVLVVNGEGDPQDKEEKTTGPNPLGLCALAIDQGTLVYALPREEKGAVQVCRSGCPDSVDVHAHDSSLACIALSGDGRLLATAGSKGTLVRIFTTHDGSKLQELLPCMASTMEILPTNPDSMASGDAGERIRPTPPPPSPLTHLSFSSDGSCIVIAGPSAAQWICCDTFQLRGLYQEKNPTRTVVSAAGDMLAKNESTCAIVCYSTTNTTFSARRWKPGFLNYHWQYGEKQMQTGGDVRAVRVHRDWTVVAYDRRLCVFGQGEIGAAPQIPGRDKNHRMMRAVDTVDNPHGICAVTSSGTTEPGGIAPFAFACPGAEPGELRVERWVAGEFVPLVIRAAHASRINAVAMSPDGGLVATASVRGTIVRVFRTTDGRLIGELRRGTDRADIHCIVFSPDSKWLAVSSDKATVHVFRVADLDITSSTPESGVEQKQNAPEEGGQATPATTTPPPAESLPAPAKANKGSSLSFLKGYLPSYFSSEWSLAQFRLPEGVKYSVAFEPKNNNTILIIGTNGSFYRCQFDPKNAGDMVQLLHRKFMKIN